VSSIAIPKRVTMMLYHGLECCAEMGVTGMLADPCSGSDRRHEAATCLLEDVEERGWRFLRSWKTWWQSSPMNYDKSRK
jgi:hypothetical protein